MSKMRTKESRKRAQGVKGENEIYKTDISRGVGGDNGVQIFYVRISRNYDILATVQSFLFGNEFVPKISQFIYNFANFYANLYRHSACDFDPVRRKRRFFAFDPDVLHCLFDSRLYGSNMGNNFADFGHQGIC